MRVAVSGACGRMGRLVAETVAEADGLELAALFDPACTGGDVLGRPVVATPDVVADCHAVVEFTRPDVVMDNLRTWRRLGVHAVVGTSGFDAARIAEVVELWGQNPPNCLIVPNFSVGAVVMARLSELAAPHFAASEIIELHHDRKADAPSGTAIASAERIGAAGKQDRATESTEHVKGTRGGDVAGVPVHSVRLPGLLAHHETLFGNPGEILSIRHDTTDRSAFMPGVLLALGAVEELPEPVTVGLEPLLDI